MMTAATGLSNQQRRMDTIANNISNVNTVGFKSSRLDFRTALYTAGLVPGPPRTPAPEGNQQRPHGVRVAAITRDFNPGSLQDTGHPLDFAILGDGFFAIEDSFGNTVFTRNGNFNFDDAGYLVTANGHFVLNSADGRITLPPGANPEHVGVSADGVMTFMVGEDEVRITLGLSTFRNIMGLEALGDSNYGETIASGERLPVGSDVSVVQGMLELSNVNLGLEMTRLIRTQRAFQLASRALSTADEMEGIANNMRR